LEKLPELVSRLRSVLQRFADALGCIDQCFIADDMLEQLPVASRAKPSSAASISTKRACAWSSRR
jgi:hypothetical protein